MSSRLVNSSQVWTQVRLRPNSSQTRRTTSSKSKHGRSVDSAKPTQSCCQSESARLSMPKSPSVPDLSWRWPKAWVRVKSVVASRVLITWSHTRVSLVYRVKKELDPTHHHCSVEYCGDLPLSVVARRKKRIA